MRWRLLLTPPRPGVDNMALDEALMARARATGEGVVRVYAWDRPTLSLGRNQRARATFPADRLAAAGVPVVRRLTGGRALLHDREITYSVTAPAADDALGATYRAINALLLDTLRDLGVPATLAPAGERLPPPGDAPCFERPAPGELLLGGRKLVGSAQVREDGAFLQHGSILLHDDQGRIATLAAAPIAAPVPAATLAQALAHPPDAATVAAALFARVRRDWDPAATALDIPEAPEAALHAAAARYRDDAWTWRR